MSENEKSKPVTLADYIPPEPAPESTRSTTSKRNRDRLDALDREIQDDDGAQRTKSARRKPEKKKTNLWTIIFYCVLLVIIFNIVS